MRDEDKPFVCYKRGWSMKIVPRGVEGWRAFGLWMIPFGLMMAVFAAAIAAVEQGPAQIAIVIGFVAVTTVWAIIMIRWMLARSEIVDMKELLELKRQRDSNRR